jgi:hypothetical protein
VTGFIFVTRSSRRAEHLARTWGAYAARRRYTFEKGPTPERPFRIRGHRDSIDFRLEADARGDVVTRLLAHTRSSASGRVVAALGKGRRGDSDGPVAATEDPHFDRLFEVRASSPHEAAAVLRPEVRMALQRFPPRMIGVGLRLVVSGDEVLVEWAGGDVIPAEIDAAHTIVREVLKFSYRPAKTGGA